MVNIAKIVQPTATVSSVPVSGPTTGIARSLTPGQNVRTAVGSSGISGISGIVLNSTIPTISQLNAGTLTAAVNNLSCNDNHVNLTNSSGTSIVSPAAVAAVSAVNSMVPPPTSPSPAKMQPTATIQRAPGGKYSAAFAAAAAAAAAAAGHSLDQSVATATHSHAHAHPHPVAIAVPPVTVPPASARGAPPPIPPNKPIVPPKREPSLSRLASLSGSSVVAGIGVVSAASTATANSKIN